jgi:hypothetical protein
VGQSNDVHPNAPAGGGGQGGFNSAKPSGSNPDLDKFRSPQPLGTAAAAAAPANPQGATTPAAGGPAKADDSKPVTDPAIEALDLSDTAKKAAYELKKKHPSVTFTSGRRNKQEQASAMASNVVSNRNWIKETYVQSTARDNCQKWVDDNKDKKTKDEIAAGLKGVLDALTDPQLAQLSKHLSGDAFDVQPVEKDADEIKKTIKGLPGLSKFLDTEGGLVRWHAQF